MLATHTRLQRISLSLYGSAHRTSYNPLLLQGSALPGVPILHCIYVVPFWVRASNQALRKDANNCRASPKYQRILGLPPPMLFCSLS